MLNNINRIIILSNTLKNGGAEKQSILLSKALSENYNTLLVVYYGSEFDEKLKKLVDNYKINVIWLTGSHLKKVLFLYRLFRKTNNTIVFSYLATTNSINAIIGSLAGVKFRIGGIRNSTLSRSKALLQRNLHNFLLTFSIFNNYSGKNSLCSKGFKEKKAIVIHNGIEILRNYQEKIKRNSIFSVITISRLVEQKDLFTSIDAISHLLNRLTQNESKIEIKFTIIGYGHLEAKLRNYISHKEMNNYVELVINPPKVSDFLVGADIYLSTSTFEGLSNSIMEAMEYSLPIIATNVGDNNHLVKEGYNGYLVPIGASVDISKKLFELIKDDTKRICMGVNSYNLLIEKYSFETFKHNYLTFLSSLENDSKT